MGLKVEPAYIGQTGYLHPVELDRNLLEGIFQRTGAIRLGDLQASTGVGTRAVAISGGRAFLLGVENATQGGYFAWSDATETFLLAAGVGNPRIDSIILRVIDDQYGTISGSPRAEFEVVQGVAAGSPVARPDSDFNVGGSFYKPGAWWRVANARVNVGDTSIPGGQITTNNRYVRMSAGHTLCGSGDRPTDAVLGDEIFETDTKLRYWWDGAWVYDGNYRQVQLLGSNQANVTFSNIPSTIRNLRLTYSARSTTSGIQEIQVQINGITSGSYFGQLMGSVGAAAPAQTIFNAQTYARVGAIAGSDAAANRFGSGVVEFVGWNNPHSDSLTFHCQTGVWVSTTVAYNEVGQWLFVPAGPYTSLTIDTPGSFLAGSQFTLEGTF